MAKGKRVLVILQDLDIAIVQEEEAFDGSSFSAALRKIIREHARKNGRRPQSKPSKAKETTGETTAG